MGRIGDNDGFFLILDHLIFRHAQMGQYIIHSLNTTADQSFLICIGVAHFKCDRRNAHFVSRTAECSV